MAIADTKDRDYTVLDIADYKGYTGAINHIIEQENISVLGFENEDISYTQFMAFRKDLRCDRLCEIGDCVSKLRVIKDAYELECIKTAKLRSGQI